MELRRNIGARVATPEAIAREYAKFDREELDVLISQVNLGLAAMVGYMDVHGEQNFASPAFCALGVRGAFLPLGFRRRQ